jgi:hypothetical protein
MDKTIVLVLLLLVAFMFSSSIGGAIWVFRESLFGTSPSGGGGTTGKGPSQTGPTVTSGPTGISTTLNGVTFDSSGYTVGKGKIWNRSSLQTTGYDKSTAPGAVSDWYGKQTDSADACRKECVDRSACTHFGWHKDEKRCYLFQSDGDSATDNGYIRGFKNEPGKLYTYGHTNNALETSTGKTTQECKNSCDAKTACVSWDSKLTGTKDCNLKGNASLNSSAVYAEGAVGR